MAGSGMTMDPSGFYGEMGVVSKKFDSAAGSSLTTFAEQIMADAVEMTPMATGYLRSTAVIGEAFQHSGGETKIDFGFEADYAVIVHERPAEHAVGQVKFLEEACLMHADNMENELGENFMMHLGGMNML